MGKITTGYYKSVENPSIAEKQVHKTAEAAHVIHDRDLTPGEVHENVRRFPFRFNVNRHKQTILPPGLHMESYSPEDDRHDLRLFL